MNPSLGPKAIADLTGMKAANVRKLVGKMVKSGELIQPELACTPCLSRNRTYKNSGHTGHTGHTTIRFYQIISLVTLVTVTGVTGVTGVVREHWPPRCTVLRLAPDRTDTSLVKCPVRPGAGQDYCRTKVRFVRFVPALCLAFTADAQVQSRDVAPSGAAHQSCALSL